jgi:hypothetical protein
MKDEFYYKFKAFLEGAEYQNVDQFLKEASEKDCKRLGEITALRIKEKIKK